MIQKKTYKNWKEICEEMGWKTTGGTYKKARLKELESLCRYHKEGNKFIIDEIYDKPKEIIDLRGCNGLYSNDIQELLLCVFYKSEDNKVQWALNTILEKVNMINLNYIKYRKDMKNLSKETNIEKEYIEDFYNCNHSKFRSKVESSLNTLRKRSLIIFSKIIMIQLNEVEIVYNDFGNPKIGNDGRVVYRSFKTTRKANECECRVILKNEKRALKKVRCKNKGEVISKGKWKEYNNFLYDLLKENNICFYYNAYEIIFNPEDIKQEIVGELGEDFTRNELNKNIQVCLIKGAKTRHENALNKEEIIMFKELNDEDVEDVKMNKIRINENYVENNITLVNTLIKSN